MMYTMEKITALCKRRGFIYPGSDIYGGFGNTYSYGPYGSLLKKNLKDLWWKMFVEERQDMVGVDGDIFMHPRVWEASGHVGGFNDLLIEDPETRHRFRVDHLIEEQHEIDVEGWDLEKIDGFLKDNPVKSPTSGTLLKGPVKQFNLMFQAEMSKTGEGSHVYLRPETAQAIFLEFKNVLDSTRVRVPFGMAQIGKAFRNEITPGNFIFRQLEFEQMEIEYFFTPPEGFEEAREELMQKPHLDEWPKEMKDYVNGFFDQWAEAMNVWCDAIGLAADKCHVVEHKPEKLSHYSKRTFDIEFDFPFGQKELYGCAYRTDFDLSQHQKFSGKKLAYRDPQTNKEYIPHVIEPTFGVGRSILAVLTSAYEEEILEDGSIRTVLHLKPVLAPVKVAVLPLMKKDGLPEKAEEVLSKVGVFGNCEYDDGGAIGKRYRRQDEIGTPVCITVDYESLEDDSVTVRDRDSMEQERVKIVELLDYLEEAYFNTKPS